MKSKHKTYMDELLENKKFREGFDKEYQSLVISERIAKLRHSRHLTQEGLARKIHTTKSAVSRYESASYSNYSVALLRRIAQACGARLIVRFEQDRKKSRLITA